MKISPLFTVILLMLVAPKLWAQDDFDTLKKRLKSAGSDPERLTVLWKIASATVFNSPDTCHRYADFCLDLASRLRNDTFCVRCHQVKSTALNAVGQYEQSRNEADYAMKCAVALGDSLQIGRVYQSLGIVAKNTNDYVAALRYYQSAHRIFLANGAEKELMNVLSLMATLFAVQDDQKSSLEMTRRAAVLAKKLGANVKLGQLYTSMAAVFAHFRMLDSAEFYHLLAIEVLEKNKADHQTLGNAYYSRATELYDQGRYQDALQMGEKALATLSKSGDSTKTMFYAIQILGEVFEKIGQPEKAQHYLETAHWGFRKFQILPNAEKNAVMLANFHEARNRPAEALKWWKIHSFFRDSIARTHHTAEIEKLKIAFDTREKERYIGELQQKTARQRRNLAAGAGLALLLIGAAFWARSRKLEQERNRLAVQVARQEKVAIQSRYEALVNQVNPHFLFNCMNVLNSLIGSAPAKAQEFAGQFSKLYRALLEQNNSELVPLRQEMELVESYIFLQKTRFDDALNVEFEDIGDAAELLVPPFALQLLLENAVKHNVIAEDVPLQIRVFREGSFLVVENRLQPRKTAPEGTRLGLQNLRERYALITSEKPDFQAVGEVFRAKIPLIPEY